jgi:hypothetical protein
VRAFLSWSLTSANVSLGTKKNHLEAAVAF